MSGINVNELELAIAKSLRLFDECTIPSNIEEKGVDIDQLWEESKDTQKPYLLWAKKFASALTKNVGRLLVDVEVVDKVAKWLNSVSENGEPYDEVENMAWSELAGGEEVADPFRELAATLLYNYLPLVLGVAERVKKHPPEKRASAGRETGG